MYSKGEFSRKRVSRKPIRIYVSTIAEQNFNIESQSELKLEFSFHVLLLPLQS